MWSATLQVCIASTRHPGRVLAGRLHWSQTWRVYLLSSCWCKPFKSSLKTPWGFFAQVRKCGLWNVLKWGLERIIFLIIKQCLSQTRGPRSEDDEHLDHFASLNTVNAFPFSTATNQTKKKTCLFYSLLTMHSTVTPKPKCYKMISLWNTISFHGWLSNSTAQTAPFPATSGPRNNKWLTLIVFFFLRVDIMKHIHKWTAS